MDGESAKTMNRRRSSRRRVDGLVELGHLRIRDPIRGPCEDGDDYAEAMFVGFSRRQRQDTSGTGLSLEGEYG